MKTVDQVVPSPPLAGLNGAAGAIAAAGPEAQPGLTRAAWVLPVHIAGSVLVQSTWLAMQFILPVLAKKKFGASNFELVLVTAAPTVFFCLSIFWNELFARRRVGAYLLIYWLIAAAPLALIARAEGFWALLIPHLISCVGGAGYHPVAGDLLKGLYPDRIRGRVYSLIWGAAMFCGAAAGFLVGQWLNVSDERFRIIMPLAAGAQLLGVLVLIRLSHATGHRAAHARKVEALLAAGIPERRRIRRLVAPIGHMGGILKADPVFARYEAAYMTYGVGWMIAYALVPILATERMNMPYDRIAQSTFVPYWLAMTAMIVPAGLLLDRLGAARSTGVSFAMLALHPLGLIAAAFLGPEGYWVLLGVTTYYGVAHAGANVGWMLGPVALAPTPEKVPQYVAIHATLVGIRGTLFQGIGVALYELTGSFTAPLLIASAAYAWSALQMFRLAPHARERLGK